MHIQNIESLLRSLLHDPERLADFSAAQQDIFIELGQKWSCFLRSSSIRTPASAEMTTETAWDASAPCTPTSHAAGPAVSPTYSLLHAAEAQATQDGAATAIVTATPTTPAAVMPAHSVAGTDALAPQPSCEATPTSPVPGPENLQTPVVPQAAPVITPASVAVQDGRGSGHASAARTSSAATPAEPIALGGAELPPPSPPPAARHAAGGEPAVAVLPNAVQGKPYSCVLPAHAVEVSVRPACGIVWNPHNHCLTGTPQTSGEVTVTIRFSQGAAGGEQKRTLYINPDPQSLWKNLPSDPSTPFYKVDRHAEHRDSPAASLLAARVRGRSHAHVGSCCDDDFSIYYSPTGRVYVLCVSDGAGSATYSRYGSQLAVQAVQQTVAGLLADTAQNYHRLDEMDDAQRQTVARLLLQKAAYQALVAHHEAAQRYEAVSLKSLSCTLLIALTLPLGDGQWFTASYWVGDGAIAIYDPHGGEVTLMGEADSGQYSGETQFLAARFVEGDALKQRIQCHRGHQMPLLLMMTDGVSDPKFETDAQLGSAARWQALWQELQTPLRADNPAQALLEWLEFWSPGNHDDRTLALLLPKVSSGGAA